MKPMPLLRAFPFALAFVLLAACKPAAERQETPSIAPVAAAPALIPEPATLQVGDGQFVVDAGTRLHAEGEAAQRVAGLFNGYLKASGRPEIPLDADGKGGIRFEIAADASPSPEGYMLDVAPDGIVVRAGEETGLFRGATTLLQLLVPADGDRVAVRTLHIEDAPRFGWRGAMLDSARHIQSVDEIKRLLDAMALLKLNMFHWHLTDDQGWRIEIPEYPKLIEVGSCRIPAGDAGIDPATGQPAPYCGHFTQDQIRDVVAYAAARHIEVMPEFDVPGHAVAAIASYPQLGVTGKPLPVSNEWGVNSNLFNTEEDTYRFFEDVLGEMVKLFPGRYVHIGGDEAVKDQWIASQRVQQQMKAQGAKDEMAMQGLLVARLEKFLAAHGKRMLGWDEILEARLPESATVMSWRGTEGGLEAAKQGHDVVMVPSSVLYFDYLQTHSNSEPPGRPSLIEMQKVYAFDPVPDALPADKRQHILGLQANLWTEHTRSFARAQHNLFPRLAAVAETGWTPKARKDYAGFLARLPAQLARWRAQGVEYARTPFEILLAAESTGDGKARVSLSNPLDYPGIRYTTDGSAPGAESPAYAGPVEVALPTQLRAAVFVDGKALADANAFDIDAASLLTRGNNALDPCGNGLGLRLEDDGPFGGERGIYNVDIFYPCWQWKQADLSGIDAIEVHAARLPYNFQLAHDEPHRKFEPARTAHGELVLRAGCKGAELARVPLPAQPDADGFVTLKASIAPQPKPTDLCVNFTGDTRPTMWVADRVTLLPAQ